MRRWMHLVEAVNANYDLQAKYKHYNELVFDNKLPDIPIIWANLKGVGGVAKVKVMRDETKRRPNPMMVRLGREDKYSSHKIVPGSLQIRVSTLYKRSEQALDQILLHEMIHIYFYTTGKLGEAHGGLFRAELRRIGGIVGFEIPLEDKVDGFELADTVAVKPFGVILVKRRNDYIYAMFPAMVVERNIDTIRDRLHRMMLNRAYRNVSLYTVADQVWSEQARKTVVQRKVGSIGFRVADTAIVDDLLRNGQLLIDIPAS